MEIKELIAEGQKLMKSKGKTAFNHDSKFKLSYSVWVNPKIGRINSSRNRKHAATNGMQTT